MIEFVAALPMYDWPEVRAETDAQWARLRDDLRAEGIDAPGALVRRNGDMPAVPGGIRGGNSAIIAPDPAVLPPDEFDPHTLWRHPNLLFAQTCWGPMEAGLADHVRIIGQPDYSAFDGGQGEFYSSAILMRSEKASVASPADGEAFIPLDLLRGGRFAYNGPDSMSGVLALTRDMEATGESLDVFSDRLETGGHRASIAAVAENRADVCAIDCRSWDLAKRFEKAAQELQVVGWTARRKGLPSIASRKLPEGMVDRLKRVVSAQLISLSSSG